MKHVQLYVHPLSHAIGLALAEQRRKRRDIKPRAIALLGRAAAKAIARELAASLEASNAQAYQPAPNPDGGMPA